MDALKAELARKRKEREEGSGGSEGKRAAEKRFKSRGQLERERRERERQEERDRERERKAKERQNEERRDRSGSATGKGFPEDEDKADGANELSVKEVKRRLRLLKQPATLFGEDEGDRRRRLKRVERELVVDTGTYANGQQANTVLEIQREEEAERQRMLRKELARREKDDDKRSQIVRYSDSGPEKEAERVAEAFKAAAEKVAAERREATMPIEEALVSYIKRMMAEWGKDIDKMPEEVRRTGDGKQTILQYKATQKSFQVLYDRIEQGTLVEDMKQALWKIVVFMKKRNYSAAMQLYVKISIGNAPWPIGVTSVGIHDRSAREKISHSFNGQAHIMNDEGMRKILHGLKRLLTWIQQEYPAAPSMSVDFTKPLTN